MTEKTKYEDVPKFDWDGETTIYSATENGFFDDADDLGKFCFFQGVAAVDMELYHCSEDVPDLTRAVLLTEYDKATFRP